MDFSLSETQLGLQELAGKVFTEQLTQAHLRQLDAQGYHDEGLWQTLAELGLLGVAIDSANGGIGEDFETLCVLLEEAGKHVVSLPLIEVVVTGALVLQGHPLAAPALGALVRGEGMISAALYEPGQSDVRVVTAQAQEVGDGWLLTGHKHLVAVADRRGVCWTAAQSVEGFGIYLFDLHGSGIERERQITTTGEYLFSLSLHDTPAKRLACGNEALKLIERAQYLSMAASAVMAVGVCSAMTRMAASYTSEREQFGKPIATFQAVAHRLADCYINTEALRGLVQQAVCSLNAGKEVDAASREAVLAANIFAAEALHQVSHAAQQVHGGTGVDRDYPLFRYCLWAKKLELAFGGQARLLQQLGRELTFQR